MRQPHIIQKQVFKIYIESESEFKTVSEQLMHLMKNELRSFIDETLSAEVGQNEFIQIDQMELDLGTLNLHNLKAEIIREFKTYFPSLIKKQIDAFRNQKNNKITAASREFQALLYFIAYGKQVWWMSSHITAVSSLHSYLQKTKRAGLVRLWTGFSEDPVNRLRLLNLIQIDDLLNIYLSTNKGVYYSDRQSWQSIINFLNEHLSSIPGRGRLHTIIKENLINFILKSSSIKNDDPLQFDMFSLLLGISLESMPPSVVSRIRSAYQRNSHKELTSSYSISYRSLVNHSFLPQGMLEIPILVDFKIFLERGYLPRALHERGYTNINGLFQYLLKHHLEEVGLLLKVLGKKSMVRARFLERISQDNITLFFKKIAPEKAPLFDWITKAYVYVQETYKPINQTNIRVVKSINEITFDIYTKENLNNLSNEAFLEMHFQRMSLKYNIKAPVLLGMVIESIYKKLKSRKSSLPFSVVILERLYEKKAGLKFNETNLSVFLSKNKIEENWNNKADKGFVIPTSILKELLELKKSGLLGKYTAKLNAILYDTFQQRKDTKSLDKVPAEEIFSRVAELLQIHEAFLKNILLINREFNKSSSSLSGQILLTLVQKEGHSSSSIYSKDLLEHLLYFRDEYQPKEIKKLIEVYISERKISLKQFEQLVQIVFKEKSSQIIKAFEVWFKSNITNLNREIQEQLQSRFIHLALQFTDPHRNLQTIFLSLPEIMQEDIKLKIHYPQQIKQLFSDVSVLNFEGKKLKKKSHVFIKEKQLLAFYSIIQLELELEGIVNDTFYKNVIYSFDLLRGKYRKEFIDILRKYSIIPEFIDFIKEESNLPLWRAIVYIMPEAITKKIVELARSSDFLFSFLSITSVSREIVQSFILSNTISFYFSMPEDIPDSYSFFIHLISQAEKEGILLNMPDLNEINVSGKSWTSFLRDIKNQGGKKNLSLKQKHPVTFLKILHDVKHWPSEHLIQRPILSAIEVKAHSAYYMLQFVLNNYAFPFGHPFEKEDINNNVAYFRDVFTNQPALLMQIQQSIKTPRQQDLFNKWMDVSLAGTFLASVFNENIQTIRLRLQLWVNRFTFLKEDSFVLQLVAYNLKTRERKSFHELVAYYLIEKTNINVLDILMVLREVDSDLSLSMLEELPSRTITRKNIRALLQIYIVNQPERFKFIDQWRIILDEFPHQVTNQQKLFVFIHFIKEDNTQTTKLAISKRIISSIPFLEKITASDAVTILAFLYKEGVDIYELIGLNPGLKTSDDVLYEALIPLIISKNLSFKSLSTIKDQVKAALQITTTSDLLPSSRLDKLTLLLEQYNEVDVMEMALLLRSKDQLKDFPFLFASAHYNTEQTISLIQKKWSGIHIQVFNSWLALLQKSSVSISDSTTIFLLRKMMALQQKKIYQEELLHVQIFLEVVRLISIKDQDIFTIVTQIQPYISLDILLQQEVFNWLNNHIKDYNSFSILLEKLDPLISKKWLNKINQFESILVEEIDSFGMEKKQISLIYQDEFLFDRIQSAIVPEEVRFWLDTGNISPADQKKIKKIVLDLPIIFFLKERNIHQQVILKIAEWVNSIELNRQFQLLLKANIKSAEVSNYFQQLLSAFFDKADRQTTTQFLLHFHKLVLKNSSWNKSAFWEKLLEETAHLPSMEKALIQIVATGKMVKHSISLKKILKWHLAKTTIKTLTPLAILEKYVIGDFQDLHNSNLSAKDIKKSIKAIWLSSNKNFPYLVYKLSSHELYRKQFVVLMQEFGEKPILVKIHPTLMADWHVLETIIYNQTGISVSNLLGIKTKEDIWDMFLYIWSTKGFKILNPMQLLREVILMLIPKMNEQVLQDLRAFNVKDLIYPEKEFWKRLLIMVPEFRSEEEKPKIWKKKKEPELDLPDEEDAIKGVTIQNAGLVLLWPYLNRFFKFLNLVDPKNAFINDAALERAIQLTQYLVNSQTEIDEQGLMLNKLLCGVDFKFHVASNFEPTPEEVSLSRKMLQGAVQNWEQMKNTRPETFQETFLQREGRLYLLDDRWELVVDKKAYDMLLDTLPWNISMIQLSWMSKRLVVIWRGK